MSSWRTGTGICEQEIARCPLYCAGHDPALAGFGCVDDMARPCRVARGEVSYTDEVARLIEATLAKSPFGAHGRND